VLQTEEVNIPARLDLNHFDLQNRGKWPYHNLPEAFPADDHPIYHRNGDKWGNAA
jgi:hypothetical protein